MAMSTRWAVHLLFDVITEQINDDDDDELLKTFNHVDTCHADKL